MLHLRSSVNAYTGKQDGCISYCYFWHLSDSLTGSKYNGNSSSVSLNQTGLALNFNYRSKYMKIKKGIGWREGVHAGIGAAG